MGEWMSGHFNPPMALFVVVLALFALWAGSEALAHYNPHTTSDWRYYFAMLATAFGVLWSGASFVYFAARFARMMTW